MICQSNEFQIEQLLLHVDFLFYGPTQIRKLGSVLNSELEKRVNTLEPLLKDPLFYEAFSEMDLATGSFSYQSDAYRKFVFQEAHFWRLINTIHREV